MESREEIARQLFTLRDYVRWAVSRFHQAGLYYGHGTDNPWDEALQLALHSLHIPHELAEQVLDARLTGEERRLLMVVFDTRVIERIPAPYLTGEAWFAGFRFKVDERVLVPRSPLAELIENDFQPWLGARQSQRVLDLCTGSGCIGIAYGLYNSDAEVDLVDLSDAALEVAHSNIERYDLQDRVRVIKSDLFDALSAGVSPACYDLILSNPPYVDADDLAAMPAEFHHEPVMALEAGEDGLMLARRILQQAADFLTDDGLLFMEVGNSGMTLEELYPQVPFTWIDFDRGGHGVMVFSREDLLLYRELFV